MNPADQVISGEAVAIDLRLAGPGSRGVAAVIDIAATTVIDVILLLTIIAVGPATNEAVFATILVVSQVLVFLGYPVAMETLWRGRTLGKAAMGLRVVRDDGGPIRFRQALMRGLAGVVLEKPGLTSGAAAFGTMMLSQRNKRLGDLFAGTVVLQERIPGRIDVPVFMPPPLAGWASTLDLTRVDEGLALRLRQFIGRASELSPQARMTLEGQLAQEVVARVGPPPPNTPEWALISAVVAERRQRSMPTPAPVAAPTAYYAQSNYPAAPAAAPPPSIEPPPPIEPPPSGGFGATELIATDLTLRRQRSGPWRARSATGQVFQSTNVSSRLSSPTAY